MQSSGSSAVDVAVWVVVLIAVALGGGFAVMAIRRKVLAQSDDANAQAGLMESLREMRDTGQISASEYEAARASMLRRVKEQIQADKRRTPDAKS